MKGSGRFGKYGDLKRKQKIRENRQAQTVYGYTHQAVPPAQDDRRKPHRAAKKEEPGVDSRPPELDPEPSEES